MILLGILIIAGIVICVVLQKRKRNAHETLQEEESASSLESLSSSSDDDEIPMTAPITKGSEPQPAQQESTEEVSMLRTQSVSDDEE